MFSLDPVFVQRAEPNAKHALQMTDWEAREAANSNKTQHRLVVRTQPKQCKDNPQKWFRHYKNHSRSNERMLEVTDLVTGEMNSSTNFMPVSEWLMLDCPYAVGEHIWVREAFSVTQFDHSEGYIESWKEYKGKLPEQCPRGHNIVLRRNWESVDHGDMKFRPSVHMPRWAAKLFLRITDVRIHQLQDISEADAIAEMGSLSGSDPIGSFKDSWDERKSFGDMWSDNPLVYALGLELELDKR